MRGESLPIDLTLNAAFRLNRLHGYARGRASATQYLKYTDFAISLRGLIFTFSGYSILQNKRYLTYPTSPNTIVACAEIYAPGVERHFSTHCSIRSPAVCTTQSADQSLVFGIIESMMTSHHCSLVPCTIYKDFISPIQRVHFAQFQTSAVMELFKVL